MKPDRCTEGPSDGLEVVGIAGHDKIPSGERSGNHGCVDNVATSGTRTGNSCGASAMLIEILDSAAS
jgi:hypothetical protein